MDDNRRDSRYQHNSYPPTNDNESWESREEPRVTDRNRDYDRHRSRRGDRDRRRSRSRSPPRRRDRDRDRERERDSDNRRYDSGHRQYEDRDCYREDHSHHQRESSSRPVKSEERHRPEHDWRLKLTNIRDAHFNRSKQAPSTSVAQNQFTNDGSFLEKFKQMAGQNSNNSSVMPNSLALASSSIPFDSEISLPPLTTMHAQESSKPCTSTEDNNEDLDGVPIKKPVPVPVPVSIGRRRTAKPLKTGVVFKKTQQSAEDEASQEKLDAWSKYLNEVKQYKVDNCVEEESSRPLVK